MRTSDTHLLMAHSDFDRINKFREWRGLVAMNPSRYEIKISKSNDLIDISFHGAELDLDGNRHQLLIDSMKWNPKRDHNWLVTSWRTR